MKRLRKFIAGVSGLSLIVGFATAQKRQGASVEDAISWERIQYEASSTDSVAAFSPDGKRAAFVTWHGDLGRDTNVYSLRLIDLETDGGACCRALLSWDFAGDPAGAEASAFERLRFLEDNRTVVFIGRNTERESQAFALNTDTGKLTKLTAHPTDVRAVATSPSGKLGAFAATKSAAGAEQERINRDGLFVWQREVFPNQRPLNHAAGVLAILSGRPGLTREYFLAKDTRPFFDSKQGAPIQPLDFNDPKVAAAPTLTLASESALDAWGSLTASPDGKRALLFPYAMAGHSMQPERYAYYRNMNAYAKRVAAPYGLVDLASGKISRLIDAPHPQFERESGDPLWSGDGRSVIIYTLQPNDPSAPPQWMEAEISTGKLSPLSLSAGWKPLAWVENGAALAVVNGATMATHRRRADGDWGTLTELGAPQGFSSKWPVAANVRSAIGVRESLTEAPELAIYEFSSGKTKVLTDLNPQLRELRFGKVELFRWKSGFQADASGYLIYPVDYIAGTRYPLVFLLDDGVLAGTTQPFLLDALQLSGHAIQMLAAQGFMVFYARSPRIPRASMETAEEGVRIREHVDSGIAALTRAGVIDPHRIGISGWSRAGFYTNYLVIHSSVPFAAAAIQDGGGRNYLDRQQPWADAELAKIRTPFLFEPHQLPSLIEQVAMADRMTAMGKPVEILYFQNGPHNLIRPQHRFRSLDTHIDWWKFWLKDEASMEPAKAEQMKQWRKLRAMRDADLKKMEEKGRLVAP